MSRISSLAFLLALGLVILWLIKRVTFYEGGTFGGIYGF